MSYILDALRRAEADRERERGQVPGLHTQPPSGGEAAPAAGQRRWLPWAGGGLLLLAGIAAGSWWASGEHEAAVPANPAPAARITTAPAVVPAPTAPPAMPALASVPMPQPAASGSPYLPPAPPPGALAAAPVPAAIASAPAPVPAAEAPIPRLAELPESLRREIPKLAISGSVYSDDPASRFLIVNGEVQHEGAKLGAELMLEQIRPHELVLRFKGQRYRQPL
ncbi:general secretion pathway protein GspB [Roseateles saccharophilus]|uniref:Type II secretion system protein B n=1 Tax=Roseateles saccharophilus TaxID=304 RepID=A0A4R3USG2_ROSSA|nr:general secretion pathway protein GspB [Roseateles saccharophilus]MDG0833371.1 hypothetical protein [Roseateles saccharophilus]TCU93821.1 type II secretion system protein B [Roseateles saccharophilus]